MIINEIIIMNIIIIIIKIFKIPCLVELGGNAIVVFM